MKNNHLVLVAAVAIAVSNLNPARGQGAPGAPRLVEGELLVKFKGGPRSAAATRTKSTMKHEVKRDFDFIGWQHVQLPAGMTVKEALARYRNLPDVLAAEPNELLQMREPTPRPWNIVGGSSAKSKTALIPNDPLLAEQYGLQKIGAAFAWNVTTGSADVVVAILDGGVSYNHEDLRGNMWRNPGEIPGNGIDDDGNGYVDDVYGIDTASHDSDPMDEGGFPFHGSSCAGVIGALGHNGRGVAGINWNVRLMAIRVYDSAGSSSAASRVEAFQYLVTMKRRGVNIRVTSNSYGATGAAYNNQAFKDAMIAAAAEGMLHVCAAANESRDIDAVPYYPAAFDLPRIISVAASDEADGLAAFSNYGRNYVDVAAPGVNVVTTGGPRTNDYAIVSGTSFACPHVSGAAALLAAAYPSANADQIKQALLESVDVFPAFTNKMVSNGRLNLARAMYHSNFTSSVPPFIVSDPRSQTVAAGHATFISVSAAGSGPLGYQWQRDGLTLAGATNATLFFSAVTTNDAGNYSVRANNPFGVVTSAVATLAVDFSVAFTKITNGPIVTDTGDAIAGSWGDYDGDGYLDLFVAKRQSDALFRNNRDGTFTKVTSGPLVTESRDSWEGAWGDFDRDGDLDLFVANLSSQTNFLYRNDGGGVFTIMTSALAGPLAADAGSSINAAWADYDNDGWLDLFVSNGADQTNQNNFLYHNNGDGTFSRVISGSIVNDGGNSVGAAWGDFDGDGFVDLFVANFAGQQNFLYHNNGDGTFAKVTNSPVVLDSGALFTAGSWGDYDDDGDLDLFVSAEGRSALYRNDGGGNFTRVNAGNLGTEFDSSVGAAWGDYDNDGFLDLFVANQNTRTHLYRNNGDGTFSRIITSLFDYESGSALGCAWADYDNDGFLDLFISGLNGAKSHLFHNNGNTNHWLAIKLLGTQSNRNGVGAKIRVAAVIGGTNRWQMREISGGGGWGAHNDVRAAFGLGDATSVDVVRIEWPSGTVQELQNVSANRFLAITEPAFALVRDVQDASVRLSSIITLSVLAYSDQPITCQWRFNNTNLVGETNVTLQITNAQLSHEGDYSVVLNDGLHSVTSRTARLIVLMNPMVLQAPLSQTIVAGGNVTLSVTVTGNPPPFLYQWRRGTSVTGTLTNIVLNERTCFFTLTNLQTNQGGIYRVVISNAAFSALSIGTNFTLTVLPDADNNGLPDDWKATFGVNDPLGDADGDGMSNLDEYRAGTNPTNALSALRIELATAPGSNTLSFLAAANKTYTVEFTEVLGSVWTKAADFVARATNRTETILVPTANDGRFYRVATPRSP